MTDRKPNKITTTTRNSCKSTLRLDDQPEELHHRIAKQSHIPCISVDRHRRTTRRSCGSTRRARRIGCRRGLGRGDGGGGGRLDAAGSRRRRSSRSASVRGSGTSRVFCGGGTRTGLARRRGIVPAPAGTRDERPGRREAAKAGVAGEVGEQAFCEVEPAECSTRSGGALVDASDHRCFAVVIDLKLLPTASRPELDGVHRDDPVIGPVSLACTSVWPSVGRIPGNRSIGEAGPLFNCVECIVRADGHGE